MEDIYVYDNVFKSTTTDYWTSGVIVHGFEGGIDGIYIHGNRGTVKPRNPPIVNGCIGLVATNTQGMIDGVYIGKNEIFGVDAPTASFELGIGIGAFVDRVYITDVNVVDNMFYGIKTFTNAGPTLNYINNLETSNIANVAELYAVQPSKFKDLGEQRSQAEFEDISDPINTTGKYTGKAVYDLTSGKPLYAVAGNPNSVWRDSAGVSVYLPV